MRFRGAAKVEVRAEHLGQEGRPHHLKEGEPRNAFFPPTENAARLTPLRGGARFQGDDDKVRAAKGVGEVRPPNVTAALDRSHGHHVSQVRRGDLW